MSDTPDFDAQQRTETAIREAVAATVGVTLHPRPLVLPGGATADLDGVDAGPTVLVEVFARRGRLKGPQLDKVARDALKLATLGRAHPSARLVIAFADADAARSVTGGSWLAEALRTWNIEVLVVDVPS
ncbi:hypothetical protein DSM112329_01560 [Paraconexibacter sp. AEG42_29]|uniref:Uncharacterized protein n=1 Tax=Paraconexibacter sp. AEG42_29 TaxID=2997339 RepID=A0AAU7AT02_9ACTN